MQRRRTFLLGLAVVAHAALSPAFGQNAPPQILQNAYSLSKGGESDVIDAGQGQYFVLRLDDITPGQ